MSDISKIIGVDIATIAKVNNIAIGGIGSIGGSDITSTPSFTGDDFTGTNGDPINTTNWVDIGSTDNWVIQNNKANCNLGGSKQLISDSLFRVSGDFNIQIDIDTFASTGDGPLFRLGGWIEDLTYGFWIGFGRPNTLSGSFKTAGSFDAGTEVARSNNYGKLGIYRIGTVHYLQYQDGGGGWTALVNKDQGNSDDMLIKIFAITGAGEAVSGNMDNFVVNSGTILWP